MGKKVKEAYILGGMRLWKKLGWGIFWVLAGSLATAGQVYAERFVYSYAAGDRYRVLSTVVEDVYVDRTLSHRAEILNRIAVTVTEAKDGAGTHQATFQTSERSVGLQGQSSFQWSREYDSQFKRDSLGRFTIAKDYYMPVVRNVPVFPDKDLAVGETWSAPAEEVHDFRDSFGISEPYRIPFTANYRYLGMREWNGISYPTFSVAYRIFDEPKAVRGTLWPTRIMGASDQIVYWDPKLGQAAAYEEQFRMVFELSNGRTVEYRGGAQAEIIEAEPMDRGQIADEIAQDIERMGIGDTTVRVVPEGVSISMEDIRFQPDSAVLMGNEKPKLDQIAEILEHYPDRDILVGGHTALAGTAEGRQKLSQERAAAVADYLIKKGARTVERVVVRGYGAEHPIADNSSEEGKKRNRRVEIILLEN
jgi:outer membrane protein OmpA-like peptidoglycan-associated protein